MKDGTVLLQEKNEVDLQYLFECLRESDIANKLLSELLPSVNAIAGGIRNTG